MAVTAATERFSSRADNYARYRPSYPAAAIDLLSARCGLVAGARVADLGSGTGILSALLLERGAQVFAVEPNDAMRACAEARLDRSKTPDATAAVNRRRESELMVGPPGTYAEPTPQRAGYLSTFEEPRCATTA